MGDTLFHCKLEIHLGNAKPILVFLCRQFSNVSPIGMHFPYLQSVSQHGITLIHIKSLQKYSTFASTDAWMKAAAEKDLEHWKIVVTILLNENKIAISVTERVVLSKTPATKLLVLRYDRAVQSCACWYGNHIAYICTKHRFSIEPYLSFTGIKSKWLRSLDLT